MSVTATVNGEEAVAAWDAEKPGYYALAIFDQAMPILDGPHATARIRQLEVKKRVRLRMPIVGLSADCQQSARVLCISQGMQDYLNKPLRQDDLCRLLRAYVSPRPKSGNEEHVKPVGAL